MCYCIGVAFCPSGTGPKFTKRKKSWTKKKFISCFFFVGVFFFLFYLPTRLNFLDRPLFWGGGQPSSLRVLFKSETQKKMEWPNVYDIGMWAHINVKLHFLYALLPHLAPVNAFIADHFKGFFDKTSDGSITLKALEPEKMLRS